MIEQSPSAPATPWGRLALLCLATLPALFFGLVIAGFRADSQVDEGAAWALVAILWTLQGMAAYTMLRRRAVSVRRAAAISAASFPATYLTLVIVISVVVSASG